MLRILQITDCHLQGDPAAELRGVNVQSSLRAVLAHVQAHHWPADHILLTGDLVHEDAAGYQVLRELLEPLNTLVHCLAGNHDLPDVLKTTLNHGHVQYRRQVLTAGWQFVLLDTTVPDSAAGALSDTELGWLDECLNAHPQRHTVVCLHHQPVPIGISWLNELGIANSADLLTRIDVQPQVRAVIWGHIHHAFAERRGTVELLGTPSTCRQFTPEVGDELSEIHARPAYRWLHLHDDGHIETGVEYVPYH